MAVKLVEGAEGGFDVVLSLRRFAFPVDIMIGDMFSHVSSNQLVNRDGCLRRGGRKIGQIFEISPFFGDQLGVALTALDGPEFAQIVIFTVDGHDGTITGFVKTVAGRGVFLAKILATDWLRRQFSLLESPARRV